MYYHSLVFFLFELDIGIYIKFIQYDYETNAFGSGKLVNCCSLAPASCLDIVESSQFQIKDTADLLNRRFGLGAGQAIHDYLNSDVDMDKTTLEIKKILEPCDPLQECLERIATNE